MSAQAYRPRRDVPFVEQLRTDPSAWLDVWAGRDPVTGEWPRRADGWDPVPTGPLDAVRLVLVTVKA